MELASLGRVPPVDRRELWSYTACLDSRPRRARDCGSSQTTQQILGALRVVIKKSTNPKNPETKSKISDSSQADIDGGLNALAGFIYQLFGSIAESIHVAKMREKGSTELLTLEKFDQDAYVACVPGTGKGKLIQYKQSNSERIIQPNELLGILEAFLTGSKKLGKAIEDLDFELATNREGSKWTKEWMASQKDDKQLREKMWRGTNDPADDHAEGLFRIAKKLEWKDYDESNFVEVIDRRARELGVLPDEMEQRVTHCLGLFFARAGNRHMHQIYRSDLDEALAGHKGAIAFRSPESRELQRGRIGNVLNYSLGNVRKHPRSFVGEIALASARHSVTVVLGKGGLGKSIATMDALSSTLADEKSRPEFAAACEYDRACEQWLVNEVAAWRGQGQAKDGDDPVVSLSRLAALPENGPLLAIYIDGTDESGGFVNGQLESERFVNRLVARSLNPSPPWHQRAISVVLSCRTQKEAKQFFRQGEHKRAHYITIQEFNDDEIREIAEFTAPEIKDRILAGLGQASSSRGRSSGPSANAAHPAALEILHQPRVWGVFSQLNQEEQLECLQFDDSGLNRLAEEYLEEVGKKARRRIKPDIAHTYLCPVLNSAAKFFRQTGRQSANDHHWDEICKDFTIDTPYLNELFRECVSVGIFEEIEGDKILWRWQQSWLCDYFIRTGGPKS